MASTSSQAHSFPFPLYQTLTHQNQSLRHHWDSGTGRCRQDSRGNGEGEDTVEPSRKDATIGAHFDDRGG